MLYLIDFSILIYLQINGIKTYPFVVDNSLNMMLKLFL